MVNLTCGISLQKAARMIAITDLVYCFFSVIVRTAISVIQASYYVQVPGNATADSSVPRANPQIPAKHTAINTKDPSTHYTTDTKSLMPHEEPAELDTNEYVFDLGNVFVFLLFLMAMMVGYIIFELWMCRLLLGASKNLDKENCKRWWWYRLTVTMVYLFICIVSTLILSRGWFSWFLELVIFYRAYELVVIHNFKNDIAATSSRVQIRNTPQ